MDDFNGFADNLTEEEKLEVCEAIFDYENKKEKKLSKKKGNRKNG